eukprot:gene12470-26231_t
MSRARPLNHIKISMDYRWKLPNHIITSLKLLSPSRYMMTQKKSFYVRSLRMTKSSSDSVNLRNPIDIARGLSKFRPVDLSSSMDPPVKFGLAASGHLPLCHTIWSQVIKKGDIVIDATCGNGHDSIMLAKMALNNSGGILHCIDIQQGALNRTQLNLSKQFNENIVLKQIYFHLINHKTFPPEIAMNSVKVIAYNLGYLPGGDENIVSTAGNTVESIRNALALLVQGGVITITCYRGHNGGKEETAAVSSFLYQLAEEQWRVFEHAPLNRPTAP